MKITLILGSIRTPRQSEKPAYYIAEKLKSAGQSIDFLDLRELDLPLFNASEAQAELPQVQRLKSSILESDATIAVFPEYNHTYGSAFKNALDYLRNREFMHRPLGLVGVSDGLVGGARALLMARGSLPTLGAVIVPTVVPIPTVITTFPDQNTCTDPKTAGMIDRMIQEITEYAPALATVREKLQRPL